MENKKMTKIDYLLAFLFGITVVVVAVAVFARYILNNSLIWSEELSRYIYTWITLIGAAVAIEKGSHVRIDILLDKLPAKVSKYVMLINYTLMTAFLVFITINGFRLVKTTQNTLSAALELPLNYVFYAALPVTSLLGIYFCIKKIIETLKSKPAADSKADREVA